MSEADRTPEELSERKKLILKAIWFSSAVLAVSFLLMFIEEKEKSLC